MSAPFFGERTNTPFAVEYPQLSNSSLRCEDGGRMGTSLQKRSDQWTQIKLSYSANGPDMFALVTSILQEPNEPEAIADWDPLSKLFPPSWTMNLENNSRYSRLFPTKIWDHENHTNVVDAQSSYEEKWGEASPTEQLSRQLSDLQVSCSWPAPSRPCSPPSDEVLNTPDPQNEFSTLNCFNQQSNIVPECSYGKKQASISRRNHSSSQIWAEFCGEDQESTTQEALRASDTESSSASFVQLPHSATTDGVWDPAVQENPLCAKRCTYESPQSLSFLTSPFQQENSIPEGKLHQNYRQNCPDNLSTLLDNIKIKHSAYPLRDSSNRLSPPPSLKHQNSSCGGDDKHLKSRSLNPPRASCATNKKRKRVNAFSSVPSANGSVVQTFGSQAAPRKCSSLQNSGFSSCKENLKPHNSVGCSPVDLQAPQQEYVGEILRDASSPGWPQGPSANRLAKGHGLENEPSIDNAGQSMGQTERRRKMNPASVSPDWTELDALRSKKKLDHLFHFINPSFLPFFIDYSQIPNFPVFHPPPFSPVNLHYENVPHLSHFINHLSCGDASAPYHTFSPQLPRKKSVPKGGPAHTLHVCLEECYKQCRLLKKERKKTQADLAKAFPENSFASSEEILLSPLPARPSRVDRLIWIQFQERATVCTLLGKMEHLCDVSIHSRISATLGRHLEAIHTTQARRKDEILNASNQRPGTSCVTMEKDILALASAVNELTSSTRKTRTTL
ncbi:uncharacterized protein LOC120318063 isoform X2 [Crotalus tigris]|nr:uncharacterized protein LOC120318063 isoform X2 [Crotalus tigris]